MWCCLALALNLVADIPPAGDRFRFAPPGSRPRTLDGWRFSRAAQAHVDRRWETEPEKRHRLEPVRELAAWHERVWWYVDELAMEGRTDDRYRRDLVGLRSLIGRDAYDRGEVPFPAPSAAFNVMR